MTSRKTHLDYRPDIDGLRAIAVTAVILFHLDVGGLRGGFAGVDVFFVISGYLITAILLARDESLFATITHFYERRVRRILPALIAMLVACCIAAFFILSPVELVDFGKSLVAALLFISNFRHTSYFDMSADFQPLLHLWSLAVEEQFYVVYPVLLALLTRFSPIRLGWALGAIALLSFVSCVAMMGHSTAFYMSSTRAWELLIGAEVLMLSGYRSLSAKAAEILASLGLALIIISFVFLKPSVDFPGYFAAVPCLGAAFVIHANTHHKTIAAKILGSRPLIWTGLISYSLYLWHWPLIVFYRRHVLRELAPADEAIIIVGTVALSYLSWRFVERPLRRARGKSRPVFATAALACLFVFVIGASTIIFHGFPARFSAEQQRILAYENYHGTAAFKAAYAPECWQDNPKRPRDLYCLDFIPGTRNLLLWGDSYAGRYQYGLGQRARENGIAFSRAFMSSCWPVINDTLKVLPADCAHFNAEVHRAFRGKRATIILAARLSTYPEAIGEIAETARVLASEGDTVLVLGGRPDLVLPAPWILADGNAVSEYSLTQPDEILAEAKLAAMLRGAPNVTFIPSTVLCGPGSCPLLLPDGVPTTWDRGHLTKEGSVYAAGKVWPVVWREILSSKY